MRGFVAIGLVCLVPAAVTADRQIEALGRGVVALRQADGHVFVSWRLVLTDPPDLAFDLYRSRGSQPAVKVNREPIVDSTCFLDREAIPDQPSTYFVRGRLDGREQAPSAAFRLASGLPARPYLPVPLRTPAGYMPNDASVGDLDGDGEYELVVHQAGRGRDNAQRGQTDPPILEAYRLEGPHEILYGACCIDDSGQGLYATGLGHGDAMHLSDFDPARPGLEVFGVHEKPTHPHGVNLRDARTGELLWSKAAPDVGRGLALDLDPRHPGAEMWAAGFPALWNSQGIVISTNRPRSCNMGIWWDGDLQREILDGVTISKWEWEHDREVRLLTGTDLGCAANNGSKANPALCADILGDWREELIGRTRDGRELRIFTTTVPTSSRFPTLMHDPIYRLGVAWQNVAYNQPAHLSFDLSRGGPWTRSRP